MVGGEIQDPGRNLPWALMAGMLIVIGLYVAVNIAYLHVLPMEDILTANSTAHPAAPSVASRAAVAALGPRAGFVLPLHDARRSARVLFDGARWLATAGPRSGFVHREHASRCDHCIRLRGGHSSGTQEL